MIITDKEEVLRTFAHWWMEGTITLPGTPSASQFVKHLHLYFKVLKTGNSDRCYSESRLRYFIDEYMEEAGRKKEEKYAQKP